MAIFAGGANARRLLGGWFINESGSLELRHIGRRGGRISVRVGDSISDQLSGPAKIEAQWRLVESFSPLTADTALAVLAELSHPGTGRRTKFPLMQPVPITAEHVLKYKNFRRFGHERTDFRDRVQEELRKLQNVRIDVVDYPGWDVSRNAWNSHGVSVYDDKLFEMQEADLAFEVAGERNPIWLVRLGAWAKIWMNAQGKVWTVQVPKSVLEFDHRPSRSRECLSKKLALHGLMLGGIAPARPVLVRRLDHLLEDIGELPEEQHRTSHWAGRTRDRLEEALLHLVERGIFKKVDWPVEFAPGSPDRFKGWTNPWLASKIHMTLTPKPAAEVPDAPPN